MVEPETEDAVTGAGCLQSPDNDVPAMEEGLGTTRATFKHDFPRRSRADREGFLLLVGEGKSHGLGIISAQRAVRTPGKAVVFGN